MTRAMILAAAAAAWAVAGGPGAAQDRVSTSDRMALFRAQTALLDGRAAQQYNNSVRLQPPRAEVPPLIDAAAAAAVPAYRGRADSSYLEPARAAARRHGIPEDLFLRLVQQESGWNPRAVSHKGAIGLAQLMPGTAQLLGVDPHDPLANLEGGARYLRRQFDAFGTWPLALAAYNAGPGAVIQHRGIPPFAETRGYVRAIWGE
ncbi:lytic transglycosylase domain-containing protein [Rubellimicrobium sp. CFH 75288]|uniref:lytic transglycosylase domain-containing protein n=1 Tax=Rubellimicrobium sp. CFH 75288 TaxID=2697034 RepID=UPI001FB6A609|nr:lytic transglycosylase domain-containing protein [Rubellimicrobium sp. CFH 75288]